MEQAISKSINISFLRVSLSPFLPLFKNNKKCLTATNSRSMIKDFCFQINKRQRRSGKKKKMRSRSKTNILIPKTTQNKNLHYYFLSPLNSPHLLSSCHPCLLTLIKKYKRTTDPRSHTH